MNDKTIFINNYFIIKYMKNELLAIKIYLNYSIELINNNYSLLLHMIINYFYCQLFIILTDLYYY